MGLRSYAKTPLLRLEPDLRHYSTANAVCSDQSENIFDDFDLAPNNEAAMEAEVCDAIAALEAIPDSGEWSKKVSEPITPSVSKKVSKRKRRSDRRDKQAIKQIQEIGGQRAKPILPLSVAKLHTSKTPSQSPLERPQPNNDNCIPSWEFTATRAKLWAANRVLFDAVAAWSFSLNLGPDQLKRALSSPRGFSAYMRRSISKALKARLGYVPDFWFAPDVNESGRLHLHGGIACRFKTYQGTKAALISAGGKWAGEGEAFQLDLKPQTKRDGWVTYALEHTGKVRKLLGGDGVVITNPLRRKAMALYERYRFNSSESL